MVEDNEENINYKEEIEEENNDEDNYDDDNDVELEIYDMALE